jgi:hypothetical protein
MSDAKSQETRPKCVWEGLQLLCFSPDTDLHREHTHSHIVATDTPHVMILEIQRFLLPKGSTDIKQHSCHITQVNISEGDIGIHINSLRYFGNFI